MVDLSRITVIGLLSLCVNVATPSTVNLVLGVLWDRAIIADVTHLEKSLETMVNLNNNTNTSVTIKTFDVTGFSQNALQTLVCGEANSSPELLFVSAVNCFMQMALGGVVRSTGTLVVVTSCGCDLGLDLGSSTRAAEVSGGSATNYLPYPPTPPGLGPVVIDVLRYLSDWREVAIIYDDATAWRVDSIMSSMMETNATLQAYKVRAQQEDSDIATILDDLILTYETPRHIMLVCSLSCQLKVINQALQYDVKNNVQAHFKFNDQWLLVADRFEISSLERAVGWIDNVAVLVPLTMAGKSAESIVEESVSQIMRTLQAFNESMESTSAPPTGCGSPSPSMQLIRDQLRYTLDRMVCDMCDAYDVLTMMYTGAGTRGSATVGTWSPSGLTTTTIFPNLHFGLNGRHLLVSTNTWPPFVYVAYNSSLPYEGLSIELLLELSRSANFTFNLTTPADGAWGGNNDGTWNGLVGELQRKEVDLVVAPLSIQESRKTVVDYAEAYYNEYTTVLAKYPDPADTKWSLYLSPFKWQVWLALAGSIPFTGLIIWLFTMLSPYYSNHKMETGLTKLDNAVLYTYGSFFTQGGIHLPSAQSGRFVVGFWWMYCIVVVATYSGNLIAFLTVSIPALPFNSLEDMVKQDVIKYGIMRDTAAYNEFVNSHNDIMRSVWNGIQEFAAKDPTVIGVKHSDLIDKVLAGGFAYINDQTGFDLAMSSHCSIQMIKESFVPLPYGVAMQNQSAYVGIFSREVIKVKEGGLITKWKKKWWPRQSFCSRGMVTAAKPVTLQDVQGAYYAASMLLSTAFIALFIEFLANRCTTWWAAKKTPQQNSSEVTQVEAIANGTVTRAVEEYDMEDKNNWGQYKSNAPKEGETVRDIYTNPEPLVDMFGRAKDPDQEPDKVSNVANGYIFSDTFSNGMAMVDLLGNPVTNGHKKGNDSPEPDKYKRTIQNESGVTTDMFGRVIGKDIKVDMFGRPIEDDADVYGRSRST